MMSITMSVEITEDHKLTIEVPKDFPVGSANLTIIQNEPSVPEPTTELERMRERLRRAGKLYTGVKVPDDYVPLTDEQLRELGTLPPGAKTSDELIDEDRGER